MAHVVAGIYSGTLDQGTGVATIADVQVGTGAGRAIQMTFKRRGDRFPAVSSLTIGGEAMTVQGADTVIPNDANNDVRSACRINPTVEGAQSLVITCTTAGSGNSPVTVLVEVIDGIDTGQAAPTPTVETGTADTSAVTEESAVGRQVITAHVLTSDAAGLDGVNVTGFTATAENGNPTIGGGLGFVTGHSAGAASVVCEAEWTDTGVPITGTIGWVATATDWLPAAAGPTIDTQPTAQTGIVAPAQTATFAIAATTSGGTLLYDWELEDGVASGVYANVADGNGATWTGQAGTSLVGTFTATTLTGRRLRCNVTDDNGTVTSDAVALTLLDGTTCADDSGTSDANGQVTGDMVTDVAVDATPAKLCLYGLYHDGTLIARALAAGVAP